MNHKTLTFSLTTLFLVALMGLTGCMSRQQRIASSNEQRKTNDSIIEYLMGKNLDSALTITDSLEKKRVIPEYKANYYRGQIHYKLGQELTAELYFKRALANKELLQERPSMHYYVSDQLSTILTVKGDQEGAVNTATEAYSIVEEDTTQDGHYWSAILLHDIGYSQMQLGHYEEAKKNFDKAWSTLKHLAEVNPSFENLYTWARITYNIIDAYTTTEQFEEAEQWLPQAEEAIGNMSKSPECDAATAEEYMAGLNTHKALVYVKTGRPQEAETAYKRFLGTNYSKTSKGLIEHSEYLELAERWNDLANLSPKVDSVILSWGTPLSLYYLKSYLSPYLKAYLKSGRKEQALAIAERIAESTDSIYEYERLHNAAELAIMYETQEKEKQIDEQKSMLKNQKYIAIMTACILILVSIIIITLLRLHNAKNLADKNKQLEEKNKELLFANKRVEESSRMKTDFIQQISHEVRTPLNILSGFTQVLTSPGVEFSEEERADINARIKSNTKRITELVNKMIELADIHSNTVIERTDTVNTVLIATMAIENSDLQGADAINFKLEFAQEVDVPIHTNSLSASRALSLLLNNAVKFTKKGNVELRITIDHTKKMVVYTVTDTGIGVPPYESERIFEEFTQLDTYYDGTGIGLSVARSITRRLGGDIVLDTSYTSGARFIMTLPNEQ